MRRIAIIGHYSTAMSLGLAATGYAINLMDNGGYRDPDFGPLHDAGPEVAPGKPRAKVYRQQQSRSHKPRDMYRQRGRP